MSVERQKDGSGAWKTVDADQGGGASLPAGGMTAQVLTKASNADGDADWETPSGGSRPSLPADTIPSSGGAGQVYSELKGSLAPGIYALIQLYDPTTEGEPYKALMEFGSAAGGSNNASRLDNDGSVYLSTTLPDQPVIDLDTSETAGWDPAPSTAPIIRFGTRFQVGPDGSLITTLPTVDPMVANALWNDTGVVKVSAAT